MNPQDSYLGSGKLIGYAIQKYGFENFKKEILFIFTDAESAFAKEQKILIPHIGNSNCYNIAHGGYGGWNHINATIDPNERKKYGLLGSKAISSRVNNDPDFKQVWAEHIRQALLKLQQDPAYKAKFLEDRKAFTFSGRTHTQATCRHLSEVMGGSRFSGENSSSYGTCWIFSTDLLVEKKINKKDLEKYIDLGWEPGRKMSKKFQKYFGEVL